MMSVCTWFVKLLPINSHAQQTFANPTVKRVICESFCDRLLNYQQKAYAYFVRNSQNGVKENNKNDVRLIGYRIWMILGDFEILKK